MKMRAEKIVVFSLAILITALFVVSAGSAQENLIHDDDIVAMSTNEDYAANPYVEGRQIAVSYKNPFLICTRIVEIADCDSGSLNATYNYSYIDWVDWFSNADSKAVASWHFNEGNTTGSTAVDSTANGNNGSVYGDTRLLLHFKENAGNKTIDASAYDNDGMLYNGSSVTQVPEPDVWKTEPAWVTGKSNYALDFDGVDDYVNVTDSASLEPASLTIETWVKVTGLPATSAGIIEKGVTDATPTGYFLTILSDGKVRISLADGTSTKNVDSNLSLSAGSWTHLAAAYNGSGISLYVNGSLENSSAWAGPISYADAADLIIGNTFNGSIDEVAVYSRALSADEIAAHYAAAEARFVEWTTGKFNYGLLFDGADDYVEVPDSTSLDITDQIAIEAWIKTSASDGMVVQKSDGTAGYELTLSGGALQGRIGTTTMAGPTSSRLVNDNFWHHVAMSYDGANVSLFIDGILDGSATTEGPGANTANLVIGANSAKNAGFFNGAIDEVRIYNQSMPPMAIETGPLEKYADLFSAYVRDFNFSAEKYYCLDKTAEALGTQSVLLKGECSTTTIGGGVTKYYDNLSFRIDAGPLVINPSNLAEYLGKNVGENLTLGIENFTIWELGSNGITNPGDVLALPPPTEPVEDMLRTYNLTYNVRDLSTGLLDVTNVQILFKHPYQTWATNYTIPEAIPAGIIDFLAGNDTYWGGRYVIYTAQPIIPEVSLVVQNLQDAYATGQTVDVDAAVYNSTAAAAINASINFTLIDPAGTEIFYTDENTTIKDNWHTMTHLIDADAVAGDWAFAVVARDLEGKVYTKSDVFSVVAVVGNLTLSPLTIEKNITTLSPMVVQVNITNAGDAAVNITSIVVSTNLEDYVFIDNSTVESPLNVTNTTYFTAVILPADTMPDGKLTGSVTIAANGQTAILPVTLNVALVPDLRLEPTLSFEILENELSYDLPIANNGSRKTENVTELAAEREDPDGIIDEVELPANISGNTSTQFTVYFTGLELETYTVKIKIAANNVTPKETTLNITVFSDMSEDISDLEDLAAKLVDDVLTLKEINGVDVGGLEDQTLELKGNVSELKAMWTNKKYSQATALLADLQDTASDIQTTVAALTPADLSTGFCGDGDCALDENGIKETAASCPDDCSMQPVTPSSSANVAIIVIIIVVVAVVGIILALSIVPGEAEKAAPAAALGI